MNFSPNVSPTLPQAKRLNMGLRVRALLFISVFLALAIGITVMAMSWNARTIVIEQVERDVEVLARVLSQSISISQQLPDQVEEVLGQGMQATATALAHFVAAAEQAGRNSDQIKVSLKRIIANSMIAEIWITDPKGRAYLNAPLEGIDFTFNPDPKVQAQASAFWPLLDGKTSVINQPMMRREIDNKHFKYVGVPGVDKSRIVQVGTPGQSLQALRDDVGVQKLVRVLVASGALKAIHVVQRDMAELASEVSGSDNRATLDNDQREILRDVMLTGKGRTQIKARYVEVFQSIRDEYDTQVGAFVVQLPRQGLDDLLKEQALAALAIGIVVFLVGGLVSLSFADRIAKPIGTVTQVAGQVGHGDFGQLEQLERTSQRSDEIGELARVFKTMATEVRNRERVLDELVGQRTRELADKNQALSDAQTLINKELDLARRLQMAILPEHFPSTARSSGYARMLPATQMGGDFYDFIALPDGRVAVVMADVSGKGVTAAFFMAVARTSINSLVRQSTSVGECLAQANDELCRQNPLDLFVTVFLAILDPVTGRLDYANGGHNPPLIRHADGRTVWLESTGDMALGVMSDMPFSSASVQLEPGDLLLAYTDGVTEAFDGQLEAYGEQRLLDLLRLCSDPAPAVVVEQLFSEVARFADGAPQSDDITVAALIWEGKAA
ncbi:MAG: SpoIIE family protein phosphatase [Betaproteobacteria bacterium]